MIDTGLLKDLWIQVVATGLGTLMAISNGMSYGWTSPMVPYLMSNDSHIPITHQAGELFETIYLGGAAVGLPSSIYAVNKLGRKGSMLFASALGCVCWILILTANNVFQIFVARFFAGVAGNMVFIGAPMYIAEISDPRIRGFMSASIYTMLILGMVIVYAAGSLCAFYVVPVIGIVLTAAELILFPFMPESPYHYLYNNQDEKAKASLERLRSDKSKIEKEVVEMKMAIERQKSERGRPQDLFLIKSNRRALLIMLLLNSQEHMVGISVMMMNVHTILAEAGSLYMAASTSAILFSVIMLLAVILASCIMDKFGRRILLMVSGISTGCVLLIIAIYFHLKNLGYDVMFMSWIPVASVMLYAATFKLGLGIVPIVVTGEIFSSKVKAYGITIADLFYVIPAIAFINIYAVLSNAYGIHVPFYMFTVSSFVVVTLIYFFIPETKGKTLEEIQLMLKGDSIRGRSENKNNICV